MERLEHRFQKLCMCSLTILGTTRGTMLDSLQHLAATQPCTPPNGVLSPTVLLAGDALQRHDSDTNCER